MANLRVDKITSTETFETTGSVQFDGSGDYLKVAGSGTISDGNGDFTIEGWVYKNAGATNAYFFDGRPSTGAAAGNLLIYITGNTLIFYRTASHIQTTIELNKWIHIALTRESGVYKLWIDGSLKGTHTDSTSVNLVTTTSPILGTRSSLDDTYTLNGFISNFRIIKGKAIYTSNFKPPMRELELTPETIVLACQSKTDASLEKTGKTITVGGNAVANELTPGLLTPVPKAGGGSAIKGSVEFNGTSDYLSIAANNTDFQFGNDDFTVEGWHYINSFTDNPGYGLWKETGNRRSWLIYWNPSGYSRFFVSIDGEANNISILHNVAQKVHTWLHYAFTRQGDNIHMYINGIKVGTSVISTQSLYANTSDPFTLGIWDDQYYYDGFISNLRVVKGTALYTADFIPPTRELKNVPGTVLLCCQDPNNPLTEATGKTIAGYGNLSRFNGTTELVTNGSFDSNTSSWTAANGGTITSVSGGISGNCLNVASDATSNGYARQNITTSVGQWYKLSFYHKHVDGSAGYYNIGTSNGGDQIRYYVLGTQTYWVQYVDVFQAQTTETRIQFYSRPNGNVRYDNISLVTSAAPGRTGASNFTPQVGDDRQVTFEGVTKINTDAYFYLPTGNTESREATGTYNAGTRGIFGGGLVPGDSREEIQYINIASTGDAVDFGNLTQERWGNGACASATRALWGAGLSTGPSAFWNIIDYVTIKSTGNALDFGDLTYGVPYYTGAVSNSTRGVWGGGYNSPSSPQVPSPFPSGFQNEMEYVTISSKGNGIDFGDFTARNSMATFGSPTRGIFAGGATPTRVNTIEFITIASTGDAQDFGDLIAPINYGGGCSNPIRGIVFGGYNGTADANTNVISFNTIASMGNAQDFGDLTTAKSELGACSSSTRGIVGGGWSPVKIDEMEYVTIATTGNSLAFGELANVGVYHECGTSNGHGGLG